jgi:asparagine synthase (glutamine-hydrolysing)
MDGEVFGYEDSKAQLIQNGHKFNYENNDAEYCIHLYEEIGDKAFEKFNGSFCMIIYNMITNETIVANDRFSSCPLFYSFTVDKRLLFSTQLSPILHSPNLGEKLELDMSALFEFFALHRVLGAKTYYKNIKMLEPASILHYKGGSISIKSYWEMNYQEERRSEKYYTIKLAETLKKSLKRRTKGKDKLGILLSGGLDSRMVYAASDKPMVAFTYAEDIKNKEVQTAKQIAAVKDYIHIFLNRDLSALNRYLDNINNMIEIGNGMYSIEHFHAIPFLEKIGKECDILFQANVLEVFFRGTNYPRMKLQLLGKTISLPFLHKISNENLVDTVLNKLKYSINSKHPEQLFREPYCYIFEEKLRDSVVEILEKTNHKPINIYDRFLWFDTHYIARYPSVIFELSLRHFIDSRDILFDNDLFDLYLKMPFKLRARTTHKSIFLKALKMINPKIANIPHSQEPWYSPLTPAIIKLFSRMVRTILIKFFSLKTSLSGRLISPSKLIRSNKKLKKLIWDIINDPGALDPSIFNINYIREFFKSHLQGEHNNYSFIYSLLVFGTWNKRFNPK